MFDYLKNKVASTINDVNTVIAGDLKHRIERVEKDIQDLDMQLDRRQAILKVKLQQRFDLLYQDHKVDGFAPGKYADLDPINFAEPGEESMLANIAHQIIERFPGSGTLLSQLDQSLHAFCESNYLRITEKTPFSELLETQKRILTVFDMDVEVPIYLGTKSEVMGCNAPILVLDQYTLSLLTPEQRELYLATYLGHIFFGNLQIFAFHRLMGIIDKMPSVSGIVRRGLGMIPGFGNTIARSFELARSVNDNLIRKTNLIIGLQNHLRCDRLAYLVEPDKDVVLAMLQRLCYPSLTETKPEIIESMISQGEKLDQRFRNGEVDLHMLAVIGPSANFSCYRAFKFSVWVAQERSQKIVEGCYVTKQRVKEFKHTHSAIEKEIQAEKNKIYNLEDQLSKLRAELDTLYVEQEAPEPETPKAEG